MCCVCEGDTFVRTCACVCQGQVSWGGVGLGVSFQGRGGDCKCAVTVYERRRREVPEQKGP